MTIAEKIQKAKDMLDDLFFEYDEEIGKWWSKFPGQVINYYIAVKIWEKEIYNGMIDIYFGETKDKLEHYITTNVDEFLTIECFDIETIEKPRFVKKDY